MRLPTRRLCLVTHARYPIGEPRAERAAHAARDAGYSVEVIAARGDGEPGCELLDGIRVRRLPLRRKRGVGLGRMSLDYGAFAALATLAVMHVHARRRLDVVEVHGPPEFLVACGLLPRLLGARLVLDIRDLSPHLFSARFGGRRFAAVMERLLWALVRASCALADTVITVHEPYREELVRRGVRGPKIAVVMNAPDDRLLEGVRATSRPSRSHGQAFTVAYHGTITSWYGVDVIVLALAALRSAGYDVHGCILGEGDALKDVRRLARDWNVADFIEFTGHYLPISEALQRVQSATCGVIANTPSLLNDFILSNKLLEYVALGIPVVASDLQTTRAHFGDAEVTYFRSGDPDACARALAWVFDHPVEASAKARCASRRARAYSWRANRTRYLTAINELAVTVSR